MSGRDLVLKRLAIGCAAFFLLATGSPAQQYDLLLQGGHVIDPRNQIDDGPRDVAIAGGKIAAVAEKLDPEQALKVVNAAGLYVIPGLVDIHTHVYTGTGERGSYAGDNSVYPDGFTFRTAVTTVVDAGSSGWRNFEDFKDRVIDRSRTRVLAFLNIVGHGMRGDRYEHNVEDMDPKPAAAMALKHKGLIVGIKSAHYRGPEWVSIESAIEAGKIAGIPVMVDFGSDHPERPVEVLVTEKLRPGDIYTHMYSGLRREQTPEGRVNPGLWEGRKRGVLFDVGHGGGSFVWGIAIPAMKEGFAPDSISTDLHISSMNAGMKDLLNVMSKFLAMGMPLADVILRATWNPARQIGREDLGNLSVGAPADVVVLRLQKGDFGFADMRGARLQGRQKLVSELTIHDGKVVYDLNAISRPDWDSLPKDYGPTGDRRWDALNPAPR